MAALIVCMHVECCHLFLCLFWAQTRFNVATSCEFELYSSFHVTDCDDIFSVQSICFGHSLLWAMCVNEITNNGQCEQNKKKKKAKNNCLHISIVLANRKLSTWNTFSPCDKQKHQQKNNNKILCCYLSGLFASFSRLFCCSIATQNWIHFFLVVYLIRWNEGKREKKNRKTVDTFRDDEFDKTILLPLFRFYGCNKFN